MVNSQIQEKPGSMSTGPTSERRLSGFLQDRNSLGDFGIQPADLQLDGYDQRAVFQEAFTPEFGQST